MILTVPLSIIIPAKNETRTIRRCLDAIRRLHYIPDCIVVTSDPETIESVNEFPFAEIVEYDGDMESAVNEGLKHSKNELILKMDADIILPENFLEIMIPKTKEYDLVSCPAVTRSGKMWLNFFFWLREISGRFAPIGRSTHGNSMFFKKSTILEIGGFKYDTALEKEFLRRGKKVHVLNKIRVLEYREDYTIRFILKRQFQSGLKRRQLEISFLKTLGHSILRGRPLVTIGWLVGNLKR